MKKVVLFFVALTMTLGLMASVPQGFTYQAVIRNATGELVRSEMVSVRISLLPNSAQAAAVYTETHRISSNENGLVSLIIGEGITNDNFAAIDWSAGTYFIRVETDLNGNGNYSLSSCQQLMSVPYAMYALSAGGNGSTSEAYKMQEQIDGILDYMTEISIRSQLTLKVGEQHMISCDVTPRAGQVLTWTSSDTDIATVDQNGQVTAIADGMSTITARYQSHVATCSVRVRSTDDNTPDTDTIPNYINMNVADYGLFGRTTMIPGTDTVLSLSGGTISATCQLGYISDVYAWDGDATYVSGTGFVGDGYVYHFENLPVWWITECADQPNYVGFYIGAGGFTSYPQEDNNAIEPYNCKPGQIDPASYFTFVKAQYTEGETADFDAMMANTWGSLIGENYNGTLNLNNGLYSGHINRFIFMDENENEGLDAMWAADVDWANIDPDRLWGFLWDTTNSTYVSGEGGEIVFIEPYDYATVNNVYDDNGLWTEDSAAPLRVGRKANTLKLGDMSKYHPGEIPVINGPVVIKP